MYSVLDQELVLLIRDLCLQSSPPTPTVNVKELHPTRLFCLTSLVCINCFYIFCLCFCFVRFIEIYLQCLLFLPERCRFFAYELTIGWTFRGFWWPTKHTNFFWFFFFWWVRKLSSLRHKIMGNSDIKCFNHVKVHFCNILSLTLGVGVRILLTIRLLLVRKLKLILPHLCFVDRNWSTYAEELSVN